MRHFYLRTALAVALMVPAVASAFTTRELSNVAWIATYNTNKNYNELFQSGYTAPHLDSDGLTAERIDDTHLRLNGFMGCLDFVFTLTDAYGNASASGSYLCITDTEYAVNVSYDEYATRAWQMLQCVEDRLVNYVFTYKNTSHKVLFRISRNGDGYTMKSTSPLFLYNSADSGITDFITRIYESVELTSFIPNAMAKDRYQIKYDVTDYDQYNYTCTFVPHGPEILREYPVRVEMDYTNNRVNILNFGNNGYGLRQNLNYYPNLSGFSGIEIPENGKFIIGASFDPATNKITFDKNQFAKPMIGQYVDDYLGMIFDGVFECQLQRLDLSQQQTVDELFGSYDDTKNVHHNDAENGWVSNGGKRRTYEDLNLEVEPYTYYVDMFLWYQANIEGGYYDTQIDCGDVTLQTEFVRDPNETSRSANSDPLANVQHTLFHSGNKAGSQLYDGVKEWGIVPVMNVIRNEQYVDSYELMAVPGSYNNAAELHPHLGEAIQFRRVFVNEGDTLVRRNDSPVFSAADEKNGLYKPGDFRIQRNSTGTAPETYTFFIKANYKPETGLTPTYHDIYPHTFSADVPTAADIIANDNMRIESELGAIVVRNASYPVAIYDIAGRQVYLGTDDRIELPAGIYVAKCGSYAAKLNVR